MSYLQFQTLPKGLTTEDDLGKGQVGIQHLGAPLYLELQLVKFHTHSGTNSRRLTSEATPEVVRGYRPSEREEHGVATWTGGAASSGSVVLAFGTAFTETPDVFVTAQSGNANIIVGTDTPTTSGVTLYWRNETGSTHTTMNLAWLAKGR